jgi:hypothetical protein
MPVSGNIVYHLCSHNRVSDGGMSLPDPAQASLTDSTGKRYFWSVRQPETASFLSINKLVFDNVLNI